MVKGKNQVPKLSSYFHRVCLCASAQVHTYTCTRVVNYILKEGSSWAVVVHAFYPRSQRQMDLCEFGASLVYRVPGPLRLHEKILSQKKKKEGNKLRGEGLRM